MEAKKIYNPPTIEIVCVNCANLIMIGVGEGTTPEQLGNVQNWDSDEVGDDEDLNSSIWE